MRIEDLAIRRPAPPHRGIYWLFALGALIAAWFMRAEVYGRLDLLAGGLTGRVGDWLRVDTLATDGGFTLLLLFAISACGYASQLGLGVPAATWRGTALPAVLAVARVAVAGFALMFLVGTGLESRSDTSLKAILVVMAGANLVLVGPRAVSLLRQLQLCRRMRMPSGESARGLLERVEAESLTVRVGKQALIVLTDEHTLYCMGPTGLASGRPIEVIGARDATGGAAYREAALPALHASHVITEDAQFEERMRSLPRRAALEIALIAVTLGHCVFVAARVLMA
jgi:hypothetical protein